MRTRALIALAIVLVACGKSGAPTPPVPQIPRAATDLTVAQQGPVVLLSWSFPSLTAAGTTLRGLERIRVFRVVEPLPATALGDPAGTRSGDDLPPPLALFEKMPPLAAAQFNRLREEAAVLEGEALPASVQGARAIYRDLPPLQTTDARPVRVHYAVVFESTEAKSALSNVVSIVPLSVPLPPASATGTAEAGSVALRWTPPGRTILGDEPKIVGYNVYRIPSASEPVALSTPVNDVPVSEPEYRDVPPYGTYRYLVTAVAAMKPQRSESDPAMVAEVQYRDLEPPPPPAGLTTLVEDDAIRLVWDAVDAPDLAGYRIYRETPRGRVSLTGGRTVTETLFRDERLEPAETYVYSVSSIDKEGNESARTEAPPVLSPR